ncbi:Ras-related protein [Trichinella spiralis]|uniref:Uncharacterized protein n=2 Tax=Trichinella spiralis TaxID=6334 RepID=E5SN84_TRISP|nr:hypothetical protein Tsp_08795 [Trichinella spiralis]KRY33386.1 hypothetical protein T01_12033 [Trichinella spiralis]
MIGKIIHSLFFLTTGGIIPILLNLLLVRLILKIKLKQPNLRLMAALGLSNIVHGLGCVFYHVRLTGYLESLNRTVTTRACMFHAPHITLFLLSNDMFTYSVFLICIERLVAFHASEKYVKVFSANRLNILFIFFAIFIFAKVLFYWWIALSRTDVQISNSCSFKETFGLYYYSSLLSANLAFGWITVILYIFLLVSSRIRKSTRFAKMGRFRMDRETSMTKSVFVVLLSSILFQIFPSTLNLCKLWSKKENPLLYHAIIISLQNFNLNFTAIIYMIIHPGLRQELKEWHPCRFRGTAVSPEQYNVGVYIGNGK